VAKNKSGHSQKRIARSVAAARARALTSIPEEAAGALLPDGSGFQEVTLATIIVLEEIKSPFVSKAASDAPLMDVTRALFVLSLPIEQVELVLAKSKAQNKTEPLKTFDIEVRAFARKIPLSRLKGLAEKIDAHIARAMETAIPHGERGGGGEDPSVSTPQAPAASAATQAPASDGSSSTTTS
jgi:hypothetical protein